MSERMIINGEPCERVSDFGQLREGMVIYTGPCPDHLAAFHRVMLIGKCIQFVAGGLVDKTYGMMETFEMVPSPHGPNDVITPGFVAAGHVWRVADETTNATDQKATRSHRRPVESKA